MKNIHHRLENKSGKMQDNPSYENIHYRSKNKRGKTQDNPSYEKYMLSIKK